MVIMNRSKSETSDLNWKEGWGEGVANKRAKPLAPPLSLWEREPAEPVSGVSLIMKRSEALARNVPLF